MTGTTHESSRARATPMAMPSAGHARPGSRQFRFESEQVGDGLHVLALPYTPTSPVNVFALAGDDGVWLVDAGDSTPESQESLDAQLRALGYGVGDVRAVLVSHRHPDHTGGIQRFAEAGAEVLVHPLDVRQDVRSVTQAWFRRHGMADPPEPIRYPARPPLPAARLLEDGEILRWGSATLEVIHCPGHSPGLVCFLDRARRLLFTSDHLMRRAPTPMLSSGEDGWDPLGAYLASVRKLRGLPVDTVLPGHGRPFGHLDRRVDEVLHAAEARFARVRERLAREPATAFDLVGLEGLEVRSTWATAGSPAARFALTQVLAHLRHLEHLGEVVCRTDGERIVWALA